jgi:hypothetical protein
MDSAGITTGLSKFQEPGALLDWFAPVAHSRFDPA